jgi:heat shock protein HslJ
MHRLRLALLWLLTTACDDNALVAGRMLMLASQQGAAPLQGARLELSFSEHGLSSWAGCNRMNGSYRIRGGTLGVDSLSSTLKHCEGSTDQEEWFQSFLRRGPSVQVLPNREVVLQQGGSRLVFVDATFWRATVALRGRVFTLVSQQGASLLEHATVELGFARPPRMHVMACNYLEGTYEVRDGRLRVTPEAKSAKGCPADAAARDRWLEAFLSSEQPRVETSGLSLVLQTDSVRLVFAEKQAD